MTADANPIVRFIERQRCMVLDGGMATTLEARGFDLNDDLWSAKVLLENPDAIIQVHFDFLAAGADCITTASYQASIPGFKKHGMDEKAAIDLICRSVDLARAAREQFWNDESNRRGRLRPLVAASIGPYGAYLADGSEYSGRYNIDERRLRDFHLDRWRILAASPADLLACETIPSRPEANVLLSLLDETPGRWAWISFSCRDHTQLCDGSALADAVRDCNVHPSVAAVGINCTSPGYISALIDEARRETEKPVIVYPNSGEQYEAVGKSWRPGPHPTDWEHLPEEWRRHGAAGIGGCCRIGPEKIAWLRRTLIA